MIKPLRGYVLIQEITANETASKIILGNVDTEINYVGKIVELDSNVTNDSTLQVGDNVIFKRHLFDELVDPVITDEGNLDVVKSKTKYFLGRQENVTAKVQ